MPAADQQVYAGCLQLLAVVAGLQQHAKLRWLQVLLLAAHATGSDHAVAAAQVAAAATHSWRALQQVAAARCRCEGSRGENHG